MEWLILIAVGILSGTVGSLVGLGGGVITVPALLFLASSFSTYHHITPQVAVGTSLTLVIITAFSSSLTFARQKRIDVKSGLIFFIASGPGALLGVYLTNFFVPRTFNIGFGMLMILIALILTFRDRMKRQGVDWRVKREFIDAAGTRYRYGYHPMTALVTSFLVGMISSLFGIGGGALMVPIMVIFFHFPPHVATATSMLIILLSSVIGSIAHLVLGNIDWQAVLLIAPGAYIGGKLGAYLSNRMSGKGLLIALRVMVVFVAIKMIGDGLLG